MPPPSPGTSFARFGCLFLFALPFLGVGAGVGILGSQDLRTFLASRAWPPVEGHLEKVEREAEGGFWTLSYRYTVAGEERHGDGLTIGGHGERTEAQFATYDALRKSGAPVPVHVDPQAPGHPFLERQLTLEMLQLPAFGLLFFLAGLACLLAGAVALGLDLLRAARRRAHPDRPWRWDGRFDGFRATLPAGSGVLVAWALPVVFLVVVAVFLLVAASEVFDGDGRWVVRVVFGLFLLADLLLFGFAVRATLRRLRFGAPELLFDRLPLAPGDTMRAVLTTPGELRGSADLKATLKVLKSETIRSVGPRGASRTETFTTTVHEQAVVLERGSVRRWNDRTVIPVELALPRDQPGTAPFDEPAFRWELTVVHAEPGLEFTGEFPLPVYAVAGELLEWRADPLPA